MNNSDCKQMDRYLSKLKSAIRYRLDDQADDDAQLVRNKLTELETIISDIQGKNDHVGVFVKKWVEQNARNLIGENIEIKVCGITVNSIELTFKNNFERIDVTKSRQKPASEARDIFNSIDEYFKLANTYPCAPNYIYCNFKLSKKLLRENILDEVAPILIEKLTELYNSVKANA